MSKDASEFFREHYKELDAIVKPHVDSAEWTQWQTLRPSNALRLPTSDELEVLDAAAAARAAGEALDEPARLAIETTPIKGSNEFAAAQASFTSAVSTAGLTLGELQAQLQIVRAESAGPLRRVVNWLLDHLVRVLSTVSTALAVDSWTVTVGGGFPSGVSVSIAVTFR